MSFNWLDKIAVFTGSPRYRWLNQLGLKVIRFTNEEVESEVNLVLFLIKKALPESSTRKRENEVT